MAGWLRVSVSRAFEVLFLFACPWSICSFHRLLHLPPGVVAKVPGGPTKTRTPIILITHQVPLLSRNPVALSVSLNDPITPGWSLGVRPADT